MTFILERVHYTKSVNSNFRAFWLATVNRNILGSSLFCDRSQDGVSFREIFRTRNLRDKWSGRTNKYFISDWFGKILQQLSPSGSVNSARYTYTPLFTYPSGDSCIIFPVCIRLHELISIQSHSGMNSFQFLIQMKFSFWYEISF